MNRYPHTITIQKRNGEYNPYGDNTYMMVYTGECNCFQKSMPSISEKTTGANHFCAVIPNPSMPEIGENFKVLVDDNMGNLGRTYTYVGYVTYFRRFSRVCEVYFEMAKEEVIDDSYSGV